MVGEYEPTPRTVPTRHSDRMSYDRALVHAVLDEALFCHVSFVSAGVPMILPTLYVRVGDRVYLHTSTGSRLAGLAAGGGLAVSLAVTLVDGLVLARSAFHHSMNYRSVVAHGVTVVVADADERLASLAALLDHVASGRSVDCRPPSAKELAATAVLRLPLREVSAKVRSGGPMDDAADEALPHWAGVLPLAVTAGPPQPVPGAGPAPTYLQGYGRAG